MKFIVLQSQKGGCDYTIGCGKNWEIVEADSEQEALKQIFGNPANIDEDAIDNPRAWRSENAIIVGLNGDGCPDSVEIYELGAFHATKEQCRNIFDNIQVKIDELAEEVEKIERISRREEKEEREKEEYKRLKRKFGKED